MSKSDRPFLTRVFDPGPTPDTVPLPSTGRAGRNLPAAVASGLTLLVGVVAALLFARPIFMVFVGFLVLLASWEVAGALARKNLKVALPAVYVGGLAMFVAGALGSTSWVMYATYGTLVLAIAWRLFTGGMESNAIGGITATVFIIAYIPFMASFVGLMSARSDSPWPMVFFILVVVANDLGGWLAGITFGKHPMAPKLSPKKSWEGFAGSLVLCGAVAYWATWVLGIEWWWAIPLAATGAIVGTLGDLTESLIKRGVGLKDMSEIMPGHGGIMDRLDSLLFTAPMFYLIYSSALGW